MICQLYYYHRYNSQRWYSLNAPDLTSTLIFNDLWIGIVGAYNTLLIEELIACRRLVVIQIIRCNGLKFQWHLLCENPQNVKVWKASGSWKARWSKAMKRQVAACHQEKWIRIKYNFYYIRNNSIHMFSLGPFFHHASYCCHLIIRYTCIDNDSTKQQVYNLMNWPTHGLNP